MDEDRINFIFVSVCLAIIVAVVALGLIGLVDIYRTKKAEKLRSSYAETQARESLFNAIDDGMLSIKMGPTQSSPVSMTIKSDIDMSPILLPNTISFSMERTSPDTLKMITTTDGTVTNSTSYCISKMIFREDSIKWGEGYIVMVSTFIVDGLEDSWLDYIRRKR